MIDKSSTSINVEARKPTPSSSPSPSSGASSSATASTSTSDVKSKSKSTDTTATASDATDSKAKKGGAATEAVPVAESKSATAIESIPRKLGDDFKGSAELQEDRDGTRKGGNRSVFVNRLRNALFGDVGETSQANTDPAHASGDGKGTSTAQTPEQEAAQKLGADAARLQNLSTNASNTTDPDGGGAALAVSAATDANPVTSAAALRIQGETE